MTLPALELAYTAIVDIGERRDLGATGGGHRYIIDILGGSFEGPRLCGRVLPGGADRQWLRPDGLKELDALYNLTVTLVDLGRKSEARIFGERYISVAPPEPHKADIAKIRGLLGL